MEKPEEKYKVWPTTWDRNQFMDIVESKSLQEIEKRYPLVREKYKRIPNPRPIMIECYLYFYQQMNEFLSSEEVQFPLTEKLNRLYEALRESLQVVTIELEGDDDPQVIFETLNARGQPLLPSDLLRNYIFWRAAQNKESQETLYNKYWVAFDEEFWRKEERQGRLFRPRCDLFMQHYLAFKRRQEVNIGHLFSEYKFWISTTKPFKSVENELAEMSQHREFFRRLVEPDLDTPLGQLAQVLQIFDVKTIYPLLLGLLDRELSDSILNDILTDIESYIIRRSACHLTSKGYNRLFLTILNKLPEQNLTRQAFRQILMEFQVDSAVWPRDEQFHAAWVNTTIYDRTAVGRIQFILIAIEQFMRNTKSESIDIKSVLTVEHVLPQEWLENWALPSGRKGVPWMNRFNISTDSNPEQANLKVDIVASNQRDQLLHTFGNLTLLTQPLNSSISNGPYDVKRLEILKQSALGLNRYFQNILIWDEEQIKIRGEKLFQAACSIWPWGT